MPDFLASYRDLDISAAITMRDGVQFVVPSTDVYTYTINGTVAAVGLPIGEAISNTFALGVTVQKCPYSAEQLDGAEVRVRMGVRTSPADAYEYVDAGAWYVTQVSAPEGSSGITLNGTDSLSLHFNIAYEDNAASYPQSLQSLLELVCAIAGVQLSSRAWLHSDAAIQTLPAWPEGVTLRDIVGYVAACAGGFAQINMSGELDIITGGWGDVLTLTPASYNTYTPTGGARFALNCLRVTFPITDEDATESAPVRFAVDPAVEDNATNCLAVENNPLLTEAMAQGIVAELSKYAFTGADVSWIGDPRIACGAVMRLTPLDGVEVVGYINSRQLTFDGGLMATSASMMPTLNDTSTHYSSSGRTFNADGTIPVAKIQGLSGGVVNAMLGKFDRILTGDITADRFFAQMGAVVLLEVQNFKAGSIDGEKITARSITADQLKAKTITAESGVIGDAAIGTAQLADASITSAKIVEINADVIKSGTLSTERLLLVGDDGVIYKINATSAGLTASQLEEEQYKNYINGTVIVAKSITAAQIAAEAITANEILAGTITSKQVNITELFASEATIAAINAMDIRGNTYLQLQVQDILDTPAKKVDTGSSVYMDSEQVRIRSKTTSISIPGTAENEEETEIVTIDEEGLRADVVTAEEIHSDSIVNTAQGAAHAPATAGELQVILDNLTGKYLTQTVTIDASAIAAGVFTINGLHGHGELRITGGTFTALTATSCDALITIENATFTGGETAITAVNSQLHIKGCGFNAATGLNASRRAEVELESCTGVCTFVAAAASMAVVRVTGDSVPYGSLGEINGGEVYSPYEFTEYEEPPEVGDIMTATLKATNTRTWADGWISKTTFGNALYQGRYGENALRRGCMWFDKTTISGKQIISATLTLKRYSGIGGGSAVTVTIYGTTATTDSGTPAIGTKYATINLANGATGSVDVTAAVQAIADGTINGLMIYDTRTGVFSGKTYTLGYCKLYGIDTDSPPVLNVTYQ